MAVGMFFAEVAYNPKHNIITEVRSFKTGRLLDKYSNLKFWHYVDNVLNVG